jgi:hypothetical protein
LPTVVEAGSYVGESIWTDYERRYHSSELQGGHRELPAPYVGQVQLENNGVRVQTYTSGSDIVQACCAIAAGFVRMSTMRRLSVIIIKE